MKKFEIQTLLIDSAPVMRIRMTLWGVVVASWEARHLLTGWRKSAWPIICTIIFFVGLTRRTKDVPIGELTE